MVAMNEAHTIFAHHLIQHARDLGVRSGVFVGDVRNPKVGDAHCIELGQKLSAARHHAQKRDLIIKDAAKLEYHFLGTPHRHGTCKH